MSRILLVEAHPDAAHEIEGALHAACECDVVHVATLLDAIRAAGGSRFDAAVIDADLPDGAGADILDFLRLASPRIGILLLANARDEGTALHALAHGARDVLTKDHHLDMELARRIRPLLDGSGAPDPLVVALAPTDAPKRAVRAAETDKRRRL